MIVLSGRNTIPNHNPNPTPMTLTLSLSLTLNISLFPNWVVTGTGR